MFALQAGLCNMMCQLVCVVVAGSMLLVLLMTMATASLSASFSVFLVRERANKSKHVQVRLPRFVWYSASFFDVL